MAHENVVLIGHQRGFFVGVSPVQIRKDTTRKNSGERLYDRSDWIQITGGPESLTFNFFIN